MDVPEARIALCKCKDRSRVFGVRFEEFGGGWKATWAFPIKKDGAAQREQYDKTQLKGEIAWDPGYPGCPYCHNKGFVVCTCGGLNCNDGVQTSFTCGWCGISGELEAYQGAGFNSSADR